MKVLSFGGGLGNQLFCYAFYLYMKEKYPNHRVYGLYSKRKLSEHYGLEINKWFDVELPPQRWYATIVCGFLYLWKRLVGRTKYVETKRDYCENENAIAFLAFKFTNKYFPKGEWLRFRINEDKLSEINKKTLSDIRTFQSVFVHVRRGDFLSPRYKAAFEGTCPPEYYKKAIKHVHEEVKNPMFIVFSDDILWAKNNMVLPNTTIFVDWNTGLNSPIDMYLMSQCKYAIIANSTFSFWGAYLGEKKRLVYYPQKWNNGLPSPTIFPAYWKSF